MGEARAVACNNKNWVNSLHFTEEGFMAPGQTASRDRKSAEMYYQTIFYQYEPNS